MPDNNRTIYPKQSRGGYLTSTVVVLINALILALLLSNWREAWQFEGPERPLTWFVATMGPVDWFLFLVPVLGVLLELFRSRWSGVVNVFGHLCVFLWLVLVFALASAHVLGYSEPEHIILVLVSRGLPALGASIIFAWLFRRAHRLLPSQAAGT